MTNSCNAKWKPTQNQIDDLILPAFKEMAKNSVEYIAKFQCPQVMWLTCLEILQMLLNLLILNLKVIVHTVKFCATRRTEK